MMEIAELKTERKANRNLFLSLSIHYPSANKRLCWNFQDGSWWASQSGSELADWIASGDSNAFEIWVANGSLAVYVSRYSSFDCLENLPSVEMSNWLNWNRYYRGLSVLALKCNQYLCQFSFPSAFISIVKVKEVAFICRNVLNWHLNIFKFEYLWRCCVDGWTMSRVVLVE